MQTAPADAAPKARRLCDDPVMDGLLVLSESEVRGLLPLDELADALAAGLQALSDGTASVPARIAAVGRDGLLAAMPGAAPGLGLAAKLVSVFPGNPERALPAHQALMVIFDESTGRPLAVLGATYLTAVRTAVTSAIAARAVARPDGRTVTIVGAGVQAAAHLAAFTGLSSPQEVRIVSRQATTAAALAGTHPRAVAVATVEQAVRGADVVCCCTDAAGAVLDGRWISPGTHVGSVGTGAELPRELLARARVFVESRTTATAAPPAGARELQRRDPASLIEVGEVLAGRSAGRTSPGQLTVFKSTGHAIEDLAAAGVVLRRAFDSDVGTTVPLTE